MEMSTVYRVRQEGTGQEFVLKLLRPTEDQSYFFQEAKNLQTLMRSGEELKNPDGRPIIPRVIEYKEKGDDQFVVLTLTFGRRLDEILRERGRLSEKAALSIIGKVADLLHILRTRLGRSVYDLDLHTMYWEEESDALLILEWNLLSPEGQPEIATDIALLGRLLYRMVTGIDPPALGLASVPEWREITPATQTILRTATHGDPARRYATPQIFGAACAAQLHLCGEPVINILKTLVELGEKIAAASPPMGVEQADLDQPDLLVPAYNLLTLLDLRKHEIGGAWQAIFYNLQDEFRPLLVDSIALVQRSIQFLSIPDRAAAVQELRDALTSSRDPQTRLDAYRWLQVTGITGRHELLLAMEACRCLVEYRPVQALALLSALQSAQEREVMEWLTIDAQAQLLWADMEMGARLRYPSQEESTRSAGLVTTLQKLIARLPLAYQTELAAIW